MDFLVKPRICMIAAIEEGTRAMGYKNRLPWRIFPDMKRFVALTKGNVVIMGRNTFASIGARPLSDRINIIVGRNVTPAPGIHIAKTLEQALLLAGQLKTEKIFLMGGVEIYKEGMQYADTLYLTKVEKTGIKADRYFPKEYEKIFTHVVEEVHNEHGLRFTFFTLQKKTAP